VNVGVKENVLNDEVKILPNPSNGKMLVETQMKNFTVEISDMQGRIVFAAGDEKYIDVGFLEDGMYVLKLITERQSFTKKIMLSR
jgi:aminopeptidase YwaD